MTQIRSIPMAQWRALEGAAPPVTICLEGDSMRPLIRRGRDPVTIVPLQRPLKKGDVVLFTLGDGRFVVHRVWRLRDGLVRTLGDHCQNPEPWFPQGQVLGQAVRFQRGGRTHRLDTPLARALGRGYAYRLSRFGKKIMVAETGEGGYNVTGEFFQTESFSQNAGFLKQP